MGFSYNVNVLNQKGSPAIYTDTFANRPAFGFAGRLFIANDTAAIYEDTGTAWVLIANVSSGAGTLQQVTTNGNTSNVGISVTAGGVSTNSATITSLTQGSIPFVGAAGLITQDNTNLFFNDTNNRLGINTNTPSNNLDVHGTGTNPLIGVNNTAGNQALISFSNTGAAKWRIGNSSTNTFNVFNVGTFTNAISIDSASNSTVFISSVQADDFLIQPTGYSLLASLSRNLTGTGYGVLSLRNNANGTIQPSSLTVDRTYTLPDATGTIALTSDLSAYLPLTGGTLTGSLTANSFIPNSATVPTNGMYLSAANTLNFATNSANKLTIASGGDVTLLSGAALFFGNTAVTYITGNTTTMTFANNNAIAMTLSSLRNLLINSTVDDTVNKLQVTGSAKVTGDTTIGGQLKFSTAQARIICGATNIALNNNANTVNLVIVDDATGLFTINNLAGTGSRAVLADASGNLSAPVSDISVKENIEPLKYGLDTIMLLNAVQFEFIESYKNYGKGLQIGAIAQEVEQIIPEAVFKTPLTELKGIDYNQFHGIYIKAIQEQQKIIESLIERIEILENK